LKTDANILENLLRFLFCRESGYSRNVRLIFVRLNKHFSDGGDQWLPFVDHYVGGIVKVETVHDRVFYWNFKVLTLRLLGLEVNCQLFVGALINNIGVIVNIANISASDRISRLYSVQHSILS